ncbi:MAG TPA: hypothetical protein VJH03_09820 [Blastocatellia bacterium]|nr:hypothetical protein [Blastocatellia bacterium]
MTSSFRLTLPDLAVFAALLALLALPGKAVAQNSVGGHIGVAFPLVTHAGGRTTTISDNFVAAFPMGISIKREGSKMAFDLELVPAVHSSPRNVTLTVHPGVVWDLGHNWAGGVRAAFDVDSASWGFTPLVARSFPIAGHKNNKFFIEFDLPVRFQKPAGNNITAVTFAIHFGTAF